MRRVIPYNGVMKRLTTLARCAGLAGKIGPGDLDHILRTLKFFRAPEVLFGAETRGDAGVYRITRKIAILFTVDFFAPVVDDPEAYGRISAANSLSDIWAMGGRPVAALNIVGFPDELPKEVLGKILRGGGASLPRGAGLHTGRTFRAG